MHRTVLITSLILTILIVGNGIVSNPSSTLAATLAAGDWNHRLQIAIRIVPIWALACWPWFVSLRRSSDPDRRVPAIAFSVLALALAAYLHSGIAKAPSEGVGWYVIIYYVGVWVLYLASLVLRRR